MTLRQAIKSAKTIWLFNGEMELCINKKQANQLRQNTDWVHESEHDFIEGSHWSTKGSDLFMHY